MKTVTMTTIKMGRDALPIDMENFDKEWMVINQQIVGAADKVVELEEKLTRLRNKAKLERTELSGKVRKKPEKYGIIKITEAAIKDVVESYPLEADELVIEMTTRHGKA